MISAVLMADSSREHNFRPERLITCSTSKVTDPDSSDRRPIPHKASNYLLQVKELAKELDIGFLTVGFDPRWEVKDVPIMPKNRYRCVVLTHRPPSLMQVVRGQHKYWSPA